MTFARIAAGILDHVRHLIGLRRKYGVTVVLAIEPEPACFIETTAEAIDFLPATSSGRARSRSLMSRM